MGGTPSTSVAPAAPSTPSPSTTPANGTTTTIDPVTTVAATPTIPTGTSPAPTINAASPSPHDTTITPAATERPSTPKLYSVAAALTSEADKSETVVRATATRWYNWTKQERRVQEKSKVLWYMNPPGTSAVNRTERPDTLAPATTKSTAAEITKNEPKQGSHETTTPRLTTSDRNDPSDEMDIAVAPSFQLRSTAVYSPPHGDRVLSGRRELTNTDVSNFKYYHPDERSKQPAGIHTKATMYRMNTLLKQTPLPTQSTSLSPTAMANSTHVHRRAEDPSSVRTYVSRGLQTDLELQPSSAPFAQMRYYEKQHSQVVPLSTLSNYTSSNNGFYHVAAHSGTYEPNLPPIGPPTTQLDDQPYSSSLHNPPAPPPRTSILKKSSTVLFSERPNPLGEHTHEQVLEELRKRNKNLKDGTYRVKKVHLLEKSEPPPRTVTFDLPRTKASQSILRSQKLFSN